jgi:FixJ family two-component response regulator
MTKDERNIIRKAVKSQPEKTYDQIAADLGISKPTLIRPSRARSAANAVASSTSGRQASNSKEAATRVQVGWGVSEVQAAFVTSPATNP